MIRVVSKCNLKDDSKETREATIKILEALVRATRTEEGNITYEIVQSVKNPSVLALIELWDSIEALDAHPSTEHFQKWVPQLEANLAPAGPDGPPIEVYEVIF